MYYLIVLLFVTSVTAQQDLCSCSCCTGPSCTLTFISNSLIPFCTSDTCREHCRQSNTQCQIDPPNGQILATCLSNAIASFRCQCDCCKTGTTLCTPTFVGYSTAFSCQTGSCSISCSNQYTNVCVSDQTGQTNGTCIGQITTLPTSTTTTTIAAITSGLGNNCSCLCCQSGPSCVPDIYVGEISAVQCSSTTCTQACQQRYPFSCPSLPYLGQTNGICANQNNGNTRCRCQCCDSNGCPSFEINTNQDCTSCYRLCRQNLSCGNTVSVNETCVTNTSKRSLQLSFPFIVLISIIILSFFSVFH